VAYELIGVDLLLESFVGNVKSPCIE